MNVKNIRCGLVIGLLIAAGALLHADEKTGIAAPSAKKGDPPPGNAMALSIPQAQVMLKEAIKKRYVGTMKCRWRELMMPAWEVFEFSGATYGRVRTAGFDLAAPYTTASPSAPVESFSGRASVNFRNAQEYIRTYSPRLCPGTNQKVELQPSPMFNVGYLPNPERNALFSPILMWSDAAAAEEFAAAFNRLLYAAYRNEESAEFIASARAWRESPVKPPLAPEADRESILAENAIKEKDLDSAVEHYERALEIQPMWPAGWFNLALIYSEQNNYAEATDRMKHYLELAPDAPDANDARKQMIIWEDKAAKH